MENPVNEPNSEIGYKPKIERDGESEAIALWFAAIVLLAFFVAGVMVYRGGDSDFRTAANDVAPAATLQASPSQAPAIHVHVEGVDP